MSAPELPTGAEGRSLDALVGLLCPACGEVVAEKETWIENYGNGLVMRACPKCDCESAPDEWREQPNVGSEQRAPDEDHG